MLVAVIAAVVGLFVGILLAALMHRCVLHAPPPAVAPLQARLDIVGGCIRIATGRWPRRRPRRARWCAVPRLPRPRSHPLGAPAPQAPFESKDATERQAAQMGVATRVGAAPQKLWAGSPSQLHKGAGLSAPVAELEEKW